MKRRRFGSLLFLLILPFIFRCYFSIVRVKGISMEPTFRNGCFVLVWKNHGNLEKGDVVLFQSKPKMALNIKRIAATESQIVAYGGIDNYHIPESMVFVIGDNKESSYDSRYTGPIPISFLRGKVLVKLLP